MIDYGSRWPARRREIAGQVFAPAPEPLTLRPPTESARAAHVELDRLLCAGETCEVTLELAQGGIRRLRVTRVRSGRELLADVERAT